MSLTVKEIERLRENSKKGIKEGTGKINRNGGTDASGYQKYYDSREIPRLKPLEDRVVKTEIKGKNATVPTSRLDLMRTLEAKRKESANQPIPSLKYNQATNSALKSKKQADSPIITNGNYASDGKWITTNSKLASDEKENKRKKTTDEYFKKRFMGSRST